MLEERYRKLYQDTAPSEELNKETVELMIEARNHRAKPLPEQKSKLPLILWLSAAGTVAAAFIVTVAVLAWINRGSNIDEMLGAMDLTNQIEQETDTSAKPESAPETLDKEEENDQTVDAELPDIAPMPSERFTSFEDYFKALDEKKTIGYGKTYFLAKEMIVYPDSLPKGAKLIEILQYEDGQYEYSYRLEQEDESYIINVRSQSTFPTSEEAMKAQLELIAEEEEPTYISEGNTRTYRFGKLDAIIVTVTREAPASETPEGEPPESETPEGETPKGETPEGETPESETPKGETPEGETVDAEVAPAAAAAEADETDKNKTDAEADPDKPVSSEGSEEQSTEPYDPDASVSSPAQPAPLTQEEVDALLKDFTLSRYTAKEA